MNHPVRKNSRTLESPAVSGISVVGSASMPAKGHIKSTFFKKTVIFLAIALLLSLAAVFIFLTYYAHGKAEGALSTRLGRVVSINGPIGIDWDWSTPRVHAEKIRIANMAGSKEPYMLDIEKVDFTLRVWKLLRGRIEIPDIHVLQPQIFLEKRAEEIKNWDFPAFSGANLAKGIIVPDTRANVPLIEALRVSEGVISYEDTPHNIIMKLKLDTVKGKNSPSEESFALGGDGTLADQKFKLKATGGSLELLRDTHKPFPLAFEITVGKSVFSLDGTFTDPVQLKGLDAALYMDGSNLADLFYFMHIPFPPTPPYKLKGHLEKDGNRWTFSKFDGGIGHSDLEGSVVYNTEEKRPLLSGNLFSTRLDVADLGGLIGFSPVVKIKASSNGTVLPDVPLDLERLRAGDMDLNLKAEKLNAPGWPLSDMQTHISLKSGLLELKPLQFGAADGTVKGFLQLDGRAAMPRAKMDLNLKQLSLKRFFSGSGAAFKAFSEGVFGGDIKLQGPGNSLAQVLGNSDGRIVFIMAGGKISLLLMEAADINIAKLVPLLLGKDRTTNIRCAVGDFNVYNGQLTSRVFVLDTTASNLQGDVKVNLKNETIDASLEAEPKDPSLLALQSKILVKGKLSSPSLMIDPVSTGIRAAGAVLLGAIAPVAAFLPFIDLGGGKDAACVQLINDAQNSHHTRKRQLKEHKKLQ